MIAGVCGLTEEVCAPVYNMASGIWYELNAGGLIVLRVAYESQLYQCNV